MILVKISCITLFKPLYVYVPLKIKVYLREFKRKKKKKKKIVLIPVEKISVFDIEKFFRILNKPVTIGIPLKILSTNFIENYQEAFVEIYQYRFVECKVVCLVCGHA